MHLLLLPILAITALACGGHAPTFYVGPTAVEVHDCAQVWDHFESDLQKLQSHPEFPPELFEVTIAIEAPSTQIHFNPQVIGYYMHKESFIAIGYPATGVLVHELAHRWDFLHGRVPGEDVHGPQFNEFHRRLADVVKPVDSGGYNEDFWKAREAGARGECIPMIPTREIR